MSEKVSINILNYNTFDKSRRCIESCLKQTGLEYEILLVDNNSTDGSYEQLKNMYGDKLCYLRNDANYGFAKGNNLGVKYAQQYGTKYSLLLNSDTELKGEKFLKVLVDVMNYKNCAVVAPKILTVTKNGLLPQKNDSLYLKMLRIGRVIPPIKKIDGNIRTRSVAHGSALLVDNNIFLKVGGFPEHYFMYNEELTFAKNVQWNGYVIYEIDDEENLVLHHHDKTGRIEPWRLFLMGRNLSLEYWENRKHGMVIWAVIYHIYFIKMFVIGLIHSQNSFFLGMKEGKRLFKMKATKEKCFKHAKSIREIYI